MLKNQNHILYQATFNTPIGAMLSLADEEKLYLLQFADRQDLEQEIELVCKKINATIQAGSTAPLRLIKSELNEYFKGSLKKFTTPLHLIGTPFQQKTWQALQQIPYGITSNYLTQARVIGNAKAYRAVANANSANRFAIVVPCHRIIKADGTLCGYNGGINRKQWLLKHEIRLRLSTSSGLAGFAGLTKKSE